MKDKFKKYYKVKTLEKEKVIFLTLINNVSDILLHASEKVSSEAYVSNNNNICVARVPYLLQIPLKG